MAGMLPAHTARAAPVMLLLLLHLFALQYHTAAIPLRRVLCTKRERKNDRETKKKKKKKKKKKEKKTTKKKKNQKKKREKTKKKKTTTKRRPRRKRRSRSRAGKQGAEGRVSVTAAAG